MKFIKKKKRGFTLIEIIATVAIFSIIVVVMVSVFTSGLKFNMMNKKTFDANSNSRAFYEAIREDRPSSGRAIPYPDNGKYIIYFNSQDQIKGLITTEFVTSKAVTYTDFSHVKGDIKAINNRYAILIEVNKVTIPAPPVDPVSKLATGVETQYYELKTWSWDLVKGENTQILRKSMITTK